MQVFDIMDLIVYQAYYDKSQLQHLDSAFTPYDNTLNAIPHLREYSFWKFLYGRHEKTNTHWGLVSWRWYEKTKIQPSHFCDWILNNPGYDVYHVDPFLDVTVSYINTWVQGDVWHSGMLNFCDILFPKIGMNISARNLIFKSDHFATCNYFIGNSKFWNEWLTYVDSILNICFHDDFLYNYLYRDTVSHNNQRITNFSFVIERLFSNFLITQKTLKVKKFPVEHISFRERFGSDHSKMVHIYHEKNKL